MVSSNSVLDPVLLLQRPASLLKKISSNLAQSYFPCAPPYLEVSSLQMKWDQLRWWKSVSSSTPPSELPSLPSPSHLPLSLADALLLPLYRPLPSLLLHPRHPPKFPSPFLGNSSSASFVKRRIHRPSLPSPVSATASSRSQDLFYGETSS